VEGYVSDWLIVGRPMAGTVGLRPVPARLFNPASLIHLAAVGGLGARAHAGSGYKAAKLGNRGLSACDFEGADADPVDGGGIMARQIAPMRTLIQPTDQ
jgi:hypothetical protein